MRFKIYFVADANENDKTLDVTVNRMISNVAMYIIFAMLIIILLENPYEIYGEVDFDWRYNFTVLMMVVRFLLKDI